MLIVIMDPDGGTASITTANSKSEVYTLPANTCILQCSSDAVVLSCQTSSERNSML